MGSRLDKNSNDVRKRIERHTFDGENGEEYSASKFGGFTDYMRRKKIKLQNLDAELRSQSTDKPQIFRNIVAHVNGYTQPSLVDLHNLIVAHGGGFLQYLDGKTTVTHVIASQLTPKKKVEFARYRIVKPAWVVDSVAAGRLLPWEGYRVVDEGITQKVLGFDNGNIKTQAATQKAGYKEQSETSWYTSQVKDVANRLDHDATKVSFEDSLDDFDFSSPNLEPEELVANSPEPLNQEAENAQEEAQQPAKAKSPAVLTAEEHNAILLQNPRMAKSSTANPDFLNQYYRESRLHHLSTWKAELKAQLQARAAASSSQKRPRRPAGARRYIMHVDFDSFFAAVSLRQHPHLKDRPVVIAHGSGPGSEIASCNYPAREFGVKNGMWMKYALELCKDLNVLPYDYKAYEEASKHFYDSILAIDGVVQSISIDEALIDISETCIVEGGSDGRAVSEGSIYREQTKADELAQDLRAAVRDKTQCEVSVGIGGNILLAKTALRKAKPAGQYQVKSEEVLDFLADLTVTSLPGVAHSIGGKLEEIGIKFVKDIRTITKEKLINTLGPKTGEKLWDYSRGIDKQEVGEQVMRKSVSAEVNWGIRFINQEQAEAFVLSLCEELSKRLLEQLVKGKQLTMKIMRKAADAGLDPPKNLGHGKCDTFNKSVVLGVSTNDKVILGREAVTILRGYGFPPGELRGLGVQMQKLEPMRPSTHVVGFVDSSQRRLQFKKPQVMSEIGPGHAVVADAINAEQPAAKKTAWFTPMKRVASPPRRQEVGDSIEELPSPEKLEKKILNGAPESAIKTQHAGGTPLNISGTQFIVPTQIDPEVLAALPADIKSRLAPKQSRLIQEVERTKSPLLQSRSRSASPFVSDGEYALPTKSQLDPETLAALPADVREEIMAEYSSFGKAATSRQLQRVLPQSPRKNKVVSSRKINTTPTKKHKFTSLIGKSRAKRSTAMESGSTLTQANFVSMADPNGASKVDSGDEAVEISQSFLEELPEDIRQEILAEQRRQRLKNKSGLHVNASRRKVKMPTANEPRGQQKLFLPKPPPKPTFTSRKYSDLPDLRNAVSAWVQEFTSEQENGPYEEDTTALATYLYKVITVECDMAKAQAVANWLEYLVDDNEDWSVALATIKSSMQEAAKTRGVAPLPL